MKKRYILYWSLLLDERGFNAGNGDKLPLLSLATTAFFRDIHFHTLCHTR